MAREAKTLQLGPADFIRIRMQSSSPDPSQWQFLAPGLQEMLNPKEPLYQLAERFPWAQWETHFGCLYASGGRPAKPVRLMVALLLLKQLPNLGDETVVAQWVHNPYWQYLSGESVFQGKPPIEPSDLVHFRQRIGEEGMQAILALSIRRHGKAGQEKEVVIDTTVQEKNSTFPTDTKLRHRIIQRCGKLAHREGVRLRQSYRRVAKQLLLAQRWRRHPKHAKKARAAARKLKTITGRLVRELRRKLAAAALEKHGKDLALYERVLGQQRTDHDKVYSLHEPQVYCVAKGKEAKQYEFGAKASVVLTKRSGVIVGGQEFAREPVRRAHVAVGIGADRSAGGATACGGDRGSWLSRHPAGGDDRDCDADGVAERGECVCPAVDAAAVSTAGGDRTGDRTFEERLSAGAQLSEGERGRQCEPAAGGDGVQRSQVAASSRRLVARVVEMASPMSPQPEFYSRSGKQFLRID